MTSERRSEDRLAHKALNGHTHPEIGEIIDILQGPEELGGGRNGGLVAQSIKTDDQVSKTAIQVDKIEETINGGIDADLKTIHKIAILVAAFGGAISVRDLFG